MKVPFSKPHFDQEDVVEITSRIKRVLLSGWLTSGSLVQEFEKKFADLIGAQYSVALNSCTAALHALLLALDVKKGDEIIVPSNTFVATANVALYVNAKPVFADSDPETFNMSPEDVRNKISRKTKAIIIVHLGGNPCDMKEINELAEDFNVYVIEDCAHAHGSRYRGAFCGTIGIAGAFSFYPTKVITTAEGGIVTSNNKKLVERINVIRNHGREAHGPSEIIELGFNYRLSEIHAAVGLSQLRHLNKFIKARNMIASIYHHELSKIEWIEPQRVKDGNLSSYYACIVKLTDNAPKSRDKFLKKLTQHGIGTSILYHPVHLQPYYISLFGYQKGTLPVAEELGERSFALPLYNGMTEEQVRYVINIINQIAED